MKLIESILAGTGGYTKTEKKISGYIAENLVEFTVSPIGTVAKKLGISNTSLIRFAKKMGFEGYQEFRRKLQQEELKGFTAAERFRQLAGKSGDRGMETSAHIEIENLLECLSGLDVREIDAFIADVLSARQVFTCGSDVAQFLSRIMSHRMQVFGYPFQHLDGAWRSACMQMMFAGEGDMLVVFDFPEYSDSCRRAMEFARSRGMRVALVTDYVTCPLCRYADRVFYCDSQTDIFYNSLVTPVFFINCVISRLIYTDPKALSEYSDRYEELRRFEEEHGFR